MSQENEVAFCGLYCGTCVIRQGRLAHFAGQLLKSMKSADFTKLADGLPSIHPELMSDFKKSNTAIDVLTAMLHLDCTKSCRDGGGSSACKIRQCCQGKAIAGCWMCDHTDHCETLAWLEPVNKDAHLKNIKLIQTKGMQAFLDGEKFW